jgi:AcrR family transcriptional regulator
VPAARDYPDHARAFRLLWRREDEPSPRSGLTVSGIVTAAIELAGTSGLSALSMRKVATHLGVGAMSLYTYVPGKDELVMLMVDRVTSDLSDEVAADVSWRERLDAIAREYWALYHRYPWLVEVPVGRPVLGPSAFDRYEFELAAVDGLGLDDLEMNGAVELVQAHVEGTARRTFEARRDAERSGVSDDEWWFSVLPVLEEVLTDRTYPLGERVGTTIGAPHSDPQYVFEFGLARILDGLDALIRSRSGPSR